MNCDSPIDMPDAIEGLGGDESIFFMMLGNLEEMSLNQVLTDIIPAFENRDYPNMKALAHSLKGASAYIGASRLHYVCFYI
jgi:HPt (histidine-containing phosphotransfer) domain-containing protein